jgi:hypothetical protein
MVFQIANKHIKVPDSADKLFVLSGKVCVNEAPLMNELANEINNREGNNHPGRCHLLPCADFGIGAKLRQSCSPAGLWAQ